MVQDKTQTLFTEITTEESSTVNGGHYYGYYGGGYGYRRASYGYGYGRRSYGGYYGYSHYRPRYYGVSYGGYGCY